MPELAVVLAAYNEAENLAPLVEAMEDIGQPLPLVVVDDDSQDGTGPPNSSPLDSAKSWWSIVRTAWDLVRHHKQV